MEFPDLRQAAAAGCPDLVAVGGDLSVERLLLAYRTGIFPWTINPITWWCPHPRAIFELGNFHVPRSLAKVLKRCAWGIDSSSPVPGSFTVTRDRAFRQVIEQCASVPGRQTWITAEFIAAYVRLHEAGHAHSVECWQNGKLAGGIYGVVIGGLFAGESMFHHVNNASKVALSFLRQHLHQRGFVLFDIQMLTPVTRQLGAIEISREEYLRRLDAARATASFFSDPEQPADG